MSTIEVNQGERGMVRVFALSMDADEARKLRDSAGSGSIEAALGGRGRDTDFVEVFP